MFTFEFKYDWLNCESDKIQIRSVLTRREGDNPPNLVRFTQVIIYNEDGICFARGETTQHPRDRDIKEIARKTAIKNALLSLKVTRSTRARVWAAYFARKQNGVDNG